MTKQILFLSLFFGATVCAQQAQIAPPVLPYDTPIWAMILTFEGPAGVADLLTTNPALMTPDYKNEYLTLLPQFFYEETELLALAEILLMQGADINYFTQSYCATPLITAIMHEKPLLVEYFLARGADISLRSLDNIDAYDAAITNYLDNYGESNMPVRKKILSIIMVHKIKKAIAQNDQITCNMLLENAEEFDILDNVRKCYLREKAQRYFENNNKPKLDAIIERAQNFGYYDMLQEIGNRYYWQFYARVKPYKNYNRDIEEK